MTDYSYHTCPVCGIQYAVDKIVMDYKRKNDLGKQAKDASWHCPNGHSLTYTEYEVDALRRERDRLKQQEARLIEERAAEQRRADLAEARERRLKKRASAGVCPCCKKTVRQMAAHMQTNHPEFIKEQGGKVVPIKRPA